MEVKKHWYSNLPKFLKVILFILSIITVVYWLVILFYKILELVRLIGAFIFDKHNYWTLISCIIILFIGSVLIAQFVLELDPVGKATDLIVDKFNDLKRLINK